VLSTDIGDEDDDGVSSGVSRFTILDPDTHEGK
jgi:hypothetical protein